ncbi:MAG: 4'-phosphopantetheinyl transferase superfamily protein [Paludibacteraceae bacterium]|nr:4'-phosphopantetheinyl transferase superfamily protein [Paludibacteraceae bacterium]
MLILNEKINDNAILAMWKVEESVEELLSMLFNREEHRAAISKMGAEKRQKEYLVSRVMLNAVLNDDKTIAYHPNGAPYITDGSYNLSIAHTGTYVTILLHKTAKVGIDIERMSDKVVRVQSKFLSDGELQMLDPTNNKTHLTLLWAAKEALYKVMGVEVVDFVTNLTVNPFKPYLDGEMTAEENVTPDHHKYTLNYRVFPEFVLVWTIA